MQLNNEFTVDAGLQETWSLLTDLERVAPCMPGASITGREGEEFLGSSKIKVGPIGANFQGRARFLDQDDDSYTAVISMKGKDPKGATSVDATVRARLEQVTATRTKVLVDTDLEIAGRMAQFGRGAIADVSSRLMNQFTANLSALVETPSAAPDHGEEHLGSGARTTPTPEPRADELNVIELLGPVVVKRAAVPAAMFILGWLVARAFQRSPR